MRFKEEKCHLVLEEEEEEVEVEAEEGRGFVAAEIFGITLEADRLLTVSVPIAH